MDIEKKARVYTVMMVPITGQFVVLLEEVDGTRLLPIWIGRPEGESILIKLQSLELPRPITHDLFAKLLDACHAKLKKVVVTDLRENTYYAELTIEQDSKILKIDSRPSDAIAIALRTDTDIYIAKKVLDKCPVVSKPISQEEVDEFKQKLESLDPKEFFKDLDNIEG